MNKYKIEEIKSIKLVIGEEEVILNPKELIFSPTENKEVEIKKYLEYLQKVTPFNEVTDFFQLWVNESIEESFKKEK